ncbi:MAG: hypothetical protein IKG14_05925 [Clostridia bacterium]|nr:hypothetical protein [Clostridia bacterium]
MKKENLYEEIITELNYFNFKKNSTSYQYLIDVIYIVVDKKMIVKNFKNNIYPLIAKKYETKPENVLWCISKMIKLMYLNTDNKKIKEYFNIENGENPSTKAFILYISYKILKDF